MLSKTHEYNCACDLSNTEAGELFEFVNSLVTFKSVGTDQFQRERAGC